MAVAYAFELVLNIDAIFYNHKVDIRSQEPNLERSPADGIEELLNRCIYMADFIPVDSSGLVSESNRVVEIK